MKKKIIDLTSKELDKICNKFENCDDCPLYKTDIYFCLKLAIEKEIEVGKLL